MCLKPKLFFYQNHRNFTIWHYFALEKSIIKQFRLYCFLHIECNDEHKDKERKI